MPSPTVTPASRKAFNGAIPARRRRLELGLWLTPAPVSAISAISGSLSQTPCAMENRGLSTPRSPRCSMVGLP